MSPKLYSTTCLIQVICRSTHIMVHTLDYICSLEVDTGNKRHNLYWLNYYLFQLGKRSQSCKYPLTTFSGRGSLIGQQRDERSPNSRVAGNLQTLWSDVPHRRLVVSVIPAPLYVLGQERAEVSQLNGVHVVDQKGSSPSYWLIHGISTGNQPVTN